MGLLSKKPYQVKGKDGDTYYLHVINQPRYYFSKKVRKSAVATKLPAGYKVKKNTQSGLPFLVRV